MGFSIDFAPVGEGLTAIATTYHGGKVEDYRKKQEELVQIINEVNTATTPEAKQAAQAKLDAFATTIQGDPNLQQMYNQAASGVDKFQAAYDLVKQNQPNALHTKGSYDSDGRYNSGYDYDPSNSGFKFQGLTGMADMYNPLTGEKIFDSPEGGEFSDPQEFINTLRAATYDKGEWSKAQLGGHIARLNDPDYVASFPGMTPEQLRNISIEDLIRLTPERSAYYKAKGEALEFGNPVAQRTRAAKEDEELAFADRKEKQSINNHFNDWKRKRAITRADAKADAVGKSKLYSIGQDVNLSRQKIEQNNKRMGALREDIAADPTMQPFLAREGIKDAGIRTEAQLMYTISTKAKAMYGQEWHNLTDEQRDSVADSITTELKKTMPKARVYDLSAQVTKAGNDLGTIPLDQWQNMDNMLGEYYGLEENTKDHRASVTQKTAQGWTDAVRVYTEGQGKYRFNDVLSQMQLEVAPEDISKMNTAVGNLYDSIDRMNKAPEGSKARAKAQRDVDIYENEINGYLLTGGGDIVQQRIDPFATGKTAGALPLRPDPVGIDPGSAFAQQIFGSQDTVDRQGQGVSFPQPKVSEEVQQPVNFDASKGEMRMFLKALPQSEIREIVKGSAGKWYFDRFVEDIPKGNMDSKNLRQTDYADTAYEQFLGIAQGMYTGD